MAAVAFALVPALQQTVHYEWSSREPGSQPLILSERTPKSLNIEIHCMEQSCDGFVGELFASTRHDEEGTLSIVVRNREVRIMTFNGEFFDLVAAAPVTGYPISVSFEDGVVSIDGKSSVELGPSRYIVNGLYWKTNNFSTVIKLSTSPKNAVRNSPLQQILIVPILFSLVRLYRDIAPRTNLRKSLQRLKGVWQQAASPQSIFVTVLTVTASILIPPKWDDGWILFRSRGYASSALFGPHADPLLPDVGLPMSPWYDYLYGLTVAQGSSILVLRFVAILLAIVSWLLMQKYLVPAFSQSFNVRVAKWVAGATHAVFVVAWFPTLRPEPLIYAGIVATAVAVSTSDYRPPVLTVAMIGLISMPLVAIHPLAIAVPLSGLPWLWSARDKLLSAPIQALSVFMTIMSATVVLWLIGGNASTRAINRAHYRELRPYLSTDRYNFGLDALAAYFERAFTAHGTATSWSLVLFALGLIGLLSTYLNSSAVYEMPRLLSAGLLMGILAFAIQPSRHSWHLAILGPAAALGLVALTSRLRADSPQNRVAVFWLLVTIAIGIAAVAGRAASMRAALPGLSLRRVGPSFWANRIPIFFGSESNPVVWLALVGGLYLTLWVLAKRMSQFRKNNGRERFAFSLVVVCLSLIIVVVQLVPPAVDSIATAPKWTFGRQAALGLFSSTERCGLLAGEELDKVVQAARSESSVDQPTFAIHGHIALAAPCATVVGQSDGILEIPDFTLGTARHNFFRTISSELDLTLVECLDFPRERSGDRACIFQVANEDGKKPNALVPIHKEWISTRR